MKKLHMCAHIFVGKDAPNRVKHRYSVAFCDLTNALAPGVARKRLVRISLDESASRFNIKPYVTALQRVPAAMR